MKAGFTGVIEQHPNTQTIRFGNLFVNMSAIARSQNVDKSYLSRVFAGKRRPSLTHSQKIAAMLGMSLDEFVDTLEMKIKEVKDLESRTIKTHLDRIAREDQEDLDTLRAGKYPIPRLPAFRAQA